MKTWKYRCSVCLEAYEYSGSHICKKLSEIENNLGSSEGRKDDSSKTDMCNLKFDVLTEYAKVLNYGEEKYGRDNYRMVDNAERRYLSAQMRHLLARMNGEIKDPDSGLLHSAHCQANAGSLTEMDLKKEMERIDW